MTAKAVALLAVAGLLSGPALAMDASDPRSVDVLLEIDGDKEWGEYLSSECTACHADTGGRIPPVAGLPREYMLTALVDYKTGFRENATMQNVARALGDEEMAALAAYFETVDP